MLFHVRFCVTVDYPLQLTIHEIQRFSFENQWHIEYKEYNWYESVFLTWFLDDYSYYGLNQRVYIHTFIDQVVHIPLSNSWFLTADTSHESLCLQNIILDLNLMLLCII